MKELAIALVLDPERPPLTHADAMRALRAWGYDDLADDLANVLLALPVEELK